MKHKIDRVLSLIKDSDSGAIVEYLRRKLTVFPWIDQEICTNDDDYFWEKNHPKTKMVHLSNMYNSSVIFNKV